MVKIKVNSEEDTYRALRRFKKKCENEGIIKQMRNKARFEKPSEIRRREEEERLKTIRKAQNSAGDLAKN